MSELYLDDFVISKERSSVSNNFFVFRKPEDSSFIKAVNPPYSHIELRFYSFTVKLEEGFLAIAKKDVPASEFMDVSKIIPFRVNEIVSEIEGHNTHAYLMRRELGLEEIALKHQTVQVLPSSDADVLNNIIVLYPHLSSLTTKEKERVESRVTELLFETFKPEGKSMDYTFSHYVTVKGK